MLTLVPLIKRCCCWNREMWSISRFVCLLSSGDFYYIYIFFGLCEICCWNLNQVLPEESNTQKHLNTVLERLLCFDRVVFCLFFLPCFVWFVLFFSLLCSLALFDFLCLRVSFNAGGDSCCFSLPLNFLERTGSVFFSSAALVFFPPVPPLSSAPLHPGTVYCQGKYFMTLTGCSSVRPSVRPVGFTLLLTGTMNKWEETREESFCLTTRFHRLGLSCDDPSQHAQT